MNNVFDQSKFSNLPETLRAKLNREVATFNIRQQLTDVTKCNHSMEKLKLVRGRIGMAAKVVCRCGKKYG